MGTRAGGKTGENRLTTHPAGRPPENPCQAGIKSDRLLEARVNLSMEDLEEGSSI